MSSTPHPDWYLDSSLRPKKWADYIGQATVKENLKILLNAAKERNQPPEHLLFYGPPGVGKTTLAHLIAETMAAPIKITSGPAIEKVGDLASILTNLAPGDILFIDEIHRLNKTVEEILYPAMESGKLNIVIGKGPGARVIQLDLSPFTLIAATTRIALLSSPLRSRFSGGVFRLDFYTEPEIGLIIGRSAEILGTPINREVAELLASRSRFTPRTANQLLKRCRDFAQLNKANISPEVVSQTLTLLGIDDRGLTNEDRKIMETILRKFRGGPVGVNTIATATSEEVETIEEVHEPYLIQIGFLERTARGRLATQQAYQHFKLVPPDGRQLLFT